MTRQKQIFHAGFAISLILLLASIAAGADDFAHQDLGHFRYSEMSPIASWSSTIYLLLNLPVVVIGALLMALIRRLLGLSVPVTLVLFPPICVYLSYFWWSWLARRLTRSAH